MAHTWSGTSLRNKNWKLKPKKLNLSQVQYPALDSGESRWGEPKQTNHSLARSQNPVSHQDQCLKFGPRTFCDLLVGSSFHQASLSLWWSAWKFGSFFVLVKSLYSLSLSWLAWITKNKGKGDTKALPSGLVLWRAGRDHWLWQRRLALKLQLLSEFPGSEGTRELWCAHYSLSPEDPGGKASPESWGL